MAESAADPEVFWVRPETRGIIPLDGFHVPKSLARRSGKSRFDIRFDTDFDGVIDACAEEREERHIDLDQRADPRSLYRAVSARPLPLGRGVARRTGWSAASTASRSAAPSSAKACSRARRDASKVCLVHLVERLNERGFALLDTQFTTEHLKRFGAVDVPRGKYEKLLEEALKGEARFLSLTETELSRASSPGERFSSSLASSGVCEWNIIFQPSSRLT